MNFPSKLMDKLIEQIGRHLETPESLKFLGSSNLIEPRFDTQPPFPPEKKTQ